MLDVACATAVVSFMQLATMWRAEQLLLRAQACSAALRRSPCKQDINQSCLARRRRVELHGCGRDVKLENIFISGDGRVRLGDFGLTMSMKQELAISPVGTVEYMAPEAGPPSPPSQQLMEQYTDGT